ncbi:hypothetical protein OF820_04805 [Oceanotoga sp. DSM 15011]|uniref:hypothetical protein n=1 Tax=Oceanotoga sp. DSM 15011 TaxID=2984951 RepID=UPI0021F42395|nr:hypothetical protein [Oceanotoga sp. DSM 15011]UYP01006.1 hypothetical protein OF820_04805 [Oceanotoga sp. DSM 15011]
MQKIKDILTYNFNNKIETIIKLSEEYDTENLKSYIFTENIENSMIKIFEGLNSNIVGNWIYGNYGSGKTHFAKIISYILEFGLNVEYKNNIKSKKLKSLIDKSNKNFIVVKIDLSLYANSKLNLSQIIINELLHTLNIKKKFDDVSDNTRNLDTFINSLIKDNKLLLIIDEIEQFIKSSNLNSLEIQGIIHQFEISKDKYIIFISQSNPYKIEKIKSIADRIKNIIHIKDEDIEQVIIKRLLKKNISMKGLYEKYNSNIIINSDLEILKDEINLNFFEQIHPLKPEILKILPNIIQNISNRSLINIIYETLKRFENDILTRQICIYDFFESIKDTDKYKKILNRDDELEKNILKTLILYNNKLNIDTLTKLTINNITKKLIDHKIDIMKKLKKIESEELIILKEKEIILFDDYELKINKKINKINDEYLLMKKKEKTLLKSYEKIFSNLYYTSKNGKKKKLIINNSPTTLNKKKNIMITILNDKKQLNYKKILETDDEIFIILKKEKNIEKDLNKLTKILIFEEKSNIEKEINYISKIKEYYENKIEKNLKKLFESSEIYYYKEKSFFIKKDFEQEILNFINNLVYKTAYSKSLDTQKKKKDIIYIKNHENQTIIKNYPEYFKNECINTNTIEYKTLRLFNENTLFDLFETLKNKPYDWTINDIIFYIIILIKFKKIQKIDIGNSLNNTKKLKNTKIEFIKDELSEQDLNDAKRKLIHLKLMDKNAKKEEIEECIKKLYNNINLDHSENYIKDFIYNFSTIKQKLSNEFRSPFIKSLYEEKYGLIKDNNIKRLIEEIPLKSDIELWEEYKKIFNAKFEELKIYNETLKNFKYNPEKYNIYFLNYSYTGLLTALELLKNKR